MKINKKDPRLYIDTYNHINQIECYTDTPFWHAVEFLRNSLILYTVNQAQSTNALRSRQEAIGTITGIILGGHTCSTVGTSN